MQKILVPFLNVAGVIVLVIIAGVFFCSGIKKSRSKDFWQDETFGLSVAKTESCKDLIIKGAGGQGSPAPLDYFLLKAWDKARQPLHLDHVPFNVYYRLNPLLWTLIAGIGVGFLYLGRFRSQGGNYFVLFLQVLLLVQAIAYFYFRHDDFHFAIETRPYALWNSLWFSFMALFLLYGACNRTLIWMAIALGLTSSGSLFQLSVFAVCRFAMQFYETRALIPSLKQVGLELALPLAISVYYSVQCPHWNYNNSPETYHGYVKDFYAFWIGKGRLMIYALAGVLMTIFNAKWRKSSVVFLTILVLYLLSPLCNYMVLSKGFFFTRRQYVYYDLTFCIFVLNLSLMLPDYWRIICQKRRRGV